MSIIDEDKDKDYPLEYYLNQEDKFNKSEYIDEDYSDNSYLLLDFIKNGFSSRYYVLCPICRLPYIRSI